MVRWVRSDDTIEKGGTWFGGWGATREWRHTQAMMRRKQHLTHMHTCGIARERPSSSRRIFKGAIKRDRQAFQCWVHE